MTAFTLVLAVVLGASIAAPASAAPLSAVACCTGKLAASGKLGQSQIACPTKDDPACVGNAQAKLDAYFVKREPKGCRAEDEPGLVKARMTSLADQLATQSVAYDGSPCTRKQLLALAKYVKAQLKTESMDQKKPDPARYAERSAKNAAKLDKDFAKTAALAGCHTTDPAIPASMGGESAETVLAFWLPSLELTVCPTCDDGVISPAEECEHDGSGACAAVECNADCTCSICGNGVLEAGEHCDGPGNDAACPGMCNGECGCDGAAAVCGNDFIDGGEECDGANPGACPFNDPFVTTCAPPGDPVECDCCVAPGGACEFFGSISKPCCGGAACVPPNPPQGFETGVCAGP
jgi:hypothetical protein